MSTGHQCVEVKSRKRKFPTVDEIARQYYLLAKATMADRNVSSIYTIRLDDLRDDGFSDTIARFRRRMDGLAQGEGLKTVILDSRDLSIKDRDELAKLVESNDQDIGSGMSKRPKECADKLYFQLQRARAH